MELFKLSSGCDQIWLNLLFQSCDGLKFELKCVLPPLSENCSFPSFLFTVDFEKPLNTNRVCLVFTPPYLNLELSVGSKATPTNIKFAFIWCSSPAIFPVYVWLTSEHSPLGNVAKVNHLISNGPFKWTSNETFQLKTIWNPFETPFETSLKWISNDWLLLRSLNSSAALAMLWCSWAHWDDHERCCPIHNWYRKTSSLSHWCARPLWDGQLFI